jgi:hypothetical protein
VEKFRDVQATDDNIIRRTPITWWIPEATNAHSEYVIFIAFLLQKVCKKTLNVNVILKLSVLFLINIQTPKFFQLQDWTLTMSVICVVY